MRFTPGAFQYLASLRVQKGAVKRGFCDTFQALDEITKRIAHVTDELRIIHSQLEAATRNAADRQIVVDRLLAGELLNDLKSAVDNMRHVLWSYIEATAQGPEELKNAIQGYRMQRVTEMLRVLREAETEELNAVPHAHSFFEEINHIAHATVDRYNADEKKDDAAAAGKK